MLISWLYNAGSYNGWLVVSNMNGLFSISYITVYGILGCHPKPIDEVHHFQRGRLNHQPVIVGEKLIAGNLGVIPLTSERRWKAVGVHQITRGSLDFQFRTV